MAKGKGNLETIMQKEYDQKMINGAKDGYHVKEQYMEKEGDEDDEGREEGDGRHEGDKGHAEESEGGGHEGDQGFGEGVSRGGEGGPPTVSHLRHLEAGSWSKTVENRKIRLAAIWCDFHFATFCINLGLIF